MFSLSDVNISIQDYGAYYCWINVYVVMPIKYKADGIILQL